VALEEILKDTKYFVESKQGTVPDKDWLQYLLTRTMNYGGEEVSTARMLRLAQVQPSLPSREVAGRIPAEELATGLVREALLNPKPTLGHPESWPEGPWRSRCLHEDGERDGLIHAFLEHRLFVVLPQAEVLRGSQGRRIEAGWFGVGKGKFLPNLPASEQSEILRLIMKFIPLNHIS
jgi:hypothetical protein